MTLHKVVLTSSPISHYTFSGRFVNERVKKERFDNVVCGEKIDNSNAQDRNKTYEGKQGKKADGGKN